MTHFPERIYAPQAFPTEGPRSMQFVAYDPDRFDVCGDTYCHCHRSEGNTRGYGETEQEAIQDFWEQIGVEPPSTAPVMTMDEVVDSLMAQANAKWGKAEQPSAALKQFEVDREQQAVGPDYTEEEQ